MTWREAKRRELYVIAFDDPFATSADKLAATAEIERRRKLKHERVQNKEKVSYPR